MLIGWDKQGVTIWKVSKDNNRASKSPGQIVCDKLIVTDPSFTVYDDCLVIFDQPSSLFVIIDPAEEEAVCLGMWKSSHRHLLGFFDSRLAVFEGKVWDIHPDYESVVTDNESVIAALIRRDGGETAAIDLLRAKLKLVHDASQMKKLIARIGPSVRRPLAQIRFTRAIQFSGITNAHLILCGLWLYVEIMMKNKCVLDERAKVALWEIMFHPDCRAVASGLLSWCGIRLNKEALRTVLRLCDEDGFKIDANFVEDILDYVEVCLERGNLEMAKKLMLRSRMDGKFSEEPGRFLLLQKHIEGIVE
jgi:hypothetical protein